MKSKRGSNTELYSLCFSGKRKDNSRVFVTALRNCTSQNVIENLTVFIKKCDPGKPPVRRVD